KRKSQACRFVRAARLFFAVRSSRAGGSRRPLPPKFAITAILVVPSRVGRERARLSVERGIQCRRRAVCSLGNRHVHDALTAPAYRLEHDPEKACPGLDPGWIPVFGKDHAPTIN